MEYISAAGVAWLACHDLNINLMVARWRAGHPVTPWPCPMDHDYDPEAYPDPDGDIALRNDLWRTNQDCGRFCYRELGTRHAKLRIRGAQLPESVLGSIGKSVPLDAIVTVPRKCIASEAKGQVIRIINNRDSSVELLMRIAWYPITTAWMLEQL